MVRNSDGVEVQRQDFTPSADELQWAGVSDSGAPFVDGLYTFEVESYSGEDLLATNKAEVYSEIVEAKSLNGATVLVLVGGAEIATTDVSGLRGGI